ncbi:MAG: glycerate kinase [Thermodesulfobacteriota bacterium]|nr:glycerate kinase [Thermodesulfobacteriota bacterium]
MNRDTRKDILDIFYAGLDAADPKRAVMKMLSLRKGDILGIGGDLYDLKTFERIIVVGFGKAASPMALALEDIFGSRIAEGSVATKYGYGLPLKYISLAEAGHPIPDEAGLSAAKNIFRLLNDAGDKDLVICLISGGGSALMPLPERGISLKDKQETTRILLECGASIHEINAVRKHISKIKGGKFARAAFPATLVALLLSDVIGDDLDVIASGPTVPDRTTFRDCMGIIGKYDISASIPEPVISFLKDGAEGKEKETPKPGDPVFNPSHAYIIGSSLLSLKASQKKAEDLGYNTIILSSSIEGETREVAKVHTAIAKEIGKTGNPLGKPACIISGGETTVTIRGNGLGGRNTEFSLASAVEIEGMKGITVLSGGTDGTDGPTDAAGAIVDGKTVKKARSLGLDPLQYLKNNDSYHFFEATGDLLKTGPTMTNVMDLRIILAA